MALINFGKTYGGMKKTFNEETPRIINTKINNDIQQKRKKICL